MICSRLFSAVRLLVAALVVSAVLFAPMAEALHAETTPAAVCKIDHHPETTSEPEKDDSDREHHGHHCSSCHNHLVRLDLIPEHIAHSDEQSQRLPSTQNLNSLSPDPLYRPPRA